MPKQTTAFFLLILLCACLASPTARVKAPPTSPRVEDLLARMTLGEKVGQLMQYPAGWEGDPAKRVQPEHRAAIAQGAVGSFLSTFGADFTRELQRIAVEESRLGIPLLFGFDVIHGFRTTFPVPLAEASSWDPVAVEEAARIAAVEASASGIHWTFAPMLDVARDARWGRIVEGSGEDPFLGSVMGVARVRGFQGKDLGEPDTVLACAKHFVAYGAAEGGRDYNTVDVSVRALHETYLPPFRAAIDAGVGSVMAAFNDVAGVPASGHRGLMTELLRNQWGFDGFVVSDWMSVSQMIDHRSAVDGADAARQALTAGVDMEMTSTTYVENLAALLRDGKVTEGAIDAAVRRVLRAKEILGLFEDPYRYCDAEREATQVLTAEHRAAARRMAQKSMVLLRNENETLPLARALRSLAVIGPLADDAASALGSWSVPGRAEDVITPLQGIREAVGETTRVSHHRCCDAAASDTTGVDDAVAVAKAADAVILMLGETAVMSGEAASRASVELPGPQRTLALKVLALGKPTVVVLMNGRPLAIPVLAAKAPAILEAWYLGVETGHALADVLFGAVNPSGKLPVSFPRATGQEPQYYNHKSTGRPPVAEEKYTSKYIDVPIGSLYPFGHGLSYTQFAYGNLETAPAKPAASDSIEVGFTIENVGPRAGTEVAQLYIQDKSASVAPPVLALKGFARVTLKPGETKQVTLSVPGSALGNYDRSMQYAVEAGPVDVMIGSSSADIRLKKRVSLTGSTEPVEPPVLAGASPWDDVRIEEPGQIERIHSVVTH